MSKKINKRILLLTAEILDRLPTYTSVDEILARRGKVNPNDHQWIIETVRDIGKYHVNDFIRALKILRTNITGYGLGTRNHRDGRYLDDANL